MCGIVGYIGREASVPRLLDGLRRLEYRGYDSAGLAVVDGRDMAVRKTVGRLANLEGLVREQPVEGSLGIGHTRWATHGEPSTLNSHPHGDGSGRVQVVHNGIIENYQELRERLESEGCRLVSETDTEVLPNLIVGEQQANGGDFLGGLQSALQQAEGAYALGIVDREQPDVLYAARQGSPLIVGLGEDGLYIASDVPAVLPHVSEAVYLQDGEIAVLHRDGQVRVLTVDGEERPLETQTIQMEEDAAELGGFETFMLKEIHEQPRVIRSLLDRHVAHGELLLDSFAIKIDLARLLRHIILVSCGTAYYACQYGKLLWEKMLGVHVEVDLASEFRYRNPVVEPGTLVVAVSQSGETADTLASVRLAREMGFPVLSICNVHGSSLVRESDLVFYTNAGPEIGVASTKAYTAQLTAFVLLAAAMQALRGKPNPLPELLSDLEKVPDALHYLLDRKEDIRPIADKHHDGPSALYLGRRFNYPTALEGALKNKEISYQHAEGYAAGEMKHGPIALISEYLPVVCVCTRTGDELYDKMVSNMREVQARNGRIIAVATDGDRNVEGLAEDIIYVPPTSEELSPIVNVVALQLLAYYSAQARGTDIDKPRNLAKSVTVE